MLVIGGLLVKKGGYLAAIIQGEDALVAYKARQMYPDYKVSAEAVADQLLRFLSAVETGITVQQHREMVQEMTFVFNKLSLGRTELERQYDSFRSLDAAMTATKAANDLFPDVMLAKAKAKLQRETINLLSGFSSDNQNATREFEAATRDYEEKERQMQESWARVREHYRHAMAALAKGK